MGFSLTSLYADHQIKDPKLVIESTKSLLRQIERFRDFASQDDDFDCILEEIRTLQGKAANFLRLVERDSKSDEVFEVFGILDRGVLQVRQRVHDEIRFPTRRGLDRWYAVAFAFHDLVEALDAQEADSDLTNWSFRAVIDGLNFFVSGRTLVELKQECEDARAKLNIQSFDDVTINGTQFHTSGYFYSEDVCPLAVLNAQPERKGRLQVSGDFEGLPFNLTGNSKSEMQNRVDQYWGNLSRNMRTDDVQMMGTRYHTSNFWNAGAMKTIIKYNIADPLELWVARGDIDGTPFNLTAETQKDIREQCLAFYAGSLGDRKVDDVTVNGQRFSTSGYWGATEACMNVSAGATEQKQPRR